MTKAKDIIMIFAFCVALAAAVYFYFNPKPGPQAGFEDAPEPRIVTKIKRVEIPGPERIVTIEKEKIVKVFPELPTAIKDNPDAQITAVADIAPYNGVTRVAAVFDMRTGATDITAQRQTPPFFAFMNDKEIGARYGLTDAGTVFDVYGRWSFVRLGHIVGSLYAEINSGSQFKVMAMAGYRF